MTDLLSVVSVDVLCLSYDPQGEHIRLGLVRRDSEPYPGELALPGVTMRAGERLDGAAHRAIAKLTPLPPLALGQLRTFDEPSRDPRGPSLSIAMWAIVAQLPDGIPLDEIPPLAFDHSQIVENCRPILGKLMLDDLDFTRAILPSPFLTTDARAILRTLTGEDPHMGNLNRALDALPGVVKSTSDAADTVAGAWSGTTGSRRGASRGRPPVERIFVG
ncbi:NUDIX domain-containing protein [Microbacterium mitrae]|uniref:NUDIX hydrolase n=1 Tax=Microbacterium mitrae TaxID=664640 RepID=A0A5C8HRE3_9MICO|nr:NUDIX hydrolase [Microbacterium mitrae]TXK06594.1 NUDIX hydrolase [Microbacterium mitrae]